MKKTVFLIPLIVVLGIVYWWRLPATVQGPSAGHEFEYIVRTSSGSSSDDTLPMIIALHGNGDTPENFFDTLLKNVSSPSRIIIVKSPVDHTGIGSGGTAWPMDAGELRKYGDALADAVPVLVERFPTEGRPLVIGFSGGAFASYYLAVFYPDRFSFIFPLSGGLPNQLRTTGKVSLSGGVRVIAFHGTSDQVIGFHRGRDAVQYLLSRGVKAEMTTLKGGHIDIFYPSNNKVLMDKLTAALKKIPL